MGQLPTSRILTGGPGWTQQCSDPPYRPRFVQLCREGAVSSSSQNISPCDPMLVCVHQLPGMYWEDEQDQQHIPCMAFHGSGEWLPTVLCPAAYCLLSNCLLTPAQCPMPHCPLSSAPLPTVFFCPSVPCPLPYLPFLLYHFISSYRGREIPSNYSK